MRSELTNARNVEEGDRRFRWASVLPWAVGLTHLLKFKCLKCSAAYDLSGLGYGGGTLLEMVQQLALGEERARQS